MKKIISVMLLLTLYINMLSAISFAGERVEALYLEYDEGIYKYNSRLVTVVINGEEVETGDMPSIILDDHTLVPVKEIFESTAFGAEVNWNGDEKKVGIIYADKYIVFQIDNKIAYVNNVAYELEVPAKLIRNLSKDYSKTMIPLRFVSEVLGFDVEWEEESYTAMLTDPNVKEEVSEEVEETTDEDNVDIVADNTEGEKLEGISGGSANKELPTQLMENPIHWTATEEQLEEIDESYVETEITDEEHEETMIKSIKYEDSGVFKKFVVKSSSAMSNINYFIWDKKLIVDISNSVNYLSPEETYEDNPILSSIRASQYSVKPKPNSTRIVFDLIDGGNKFDFGFNEDRTNLIISVMDNSIHDIVLAQNDIGDYIKVTGVASPDVSMFRLSSPDRIVIDFPNTISVLGFNESEAEGQYIEKIRTAQFDLTTTRIVVETDGQADYEVTKASNGETIIQFKEPEYKNIEYENTETPVISLDQNETKISLEGVTYENDYLNNIYSIILSEDYGSLFGEGSIKVNDGIIETIDITETAEGLTKITIKSTRVYEYRVEEDDDKINIKAYKPKELYNQIIVVDAGHGGKDPGAIANGLYEKDVNLDITEYLKEMFDATDSVKVYYTRLSDVYPTLQERCDLANDVEADFFLSIHNNAYNPTEEGTETLYYPSDVGGVLTSPGLATIFQDSIVTVVGMKDRGIKQRENLFVLRHTTMPAIIVEIGFLTNASDAAKLKQEEYLKKAAQALYEATFKTFTSYPTKR